MNVKTPAKKTATPKTKGKAASKRRVEKKPTKSKKADEPQEGANPVGRPSSYKPEYAEQGYKLTLMGATDEKLASFFNVAESTINLWKLEYPEFSESITRGKEIADSEIAESLFHRAKGYSHPEDDIRTVAAGGNMGSEIVITPTVKHYPPDTAAASLWLRNRQPKLWRDKVETAHTGPDGGPIQHEIANLSDAERAVRLAVLLEKARAR